MSVRLVVAEEKFYLTALDKGTGKIVQIPLSANSYHKLQKKMKRLNSWWYKLWRASRRGLGLQLKPKS